MDDPQKKRFVFTLFCKEDPFFERKSFVFRGINLPGYINNKEQST